MAIGLNPNLLSLKKQNIYALDKSFVSTKWYDYQVNAYLPKFKEKRIVEKNERESEGVKSKAPLMELSR